MFSLEHVDYNIFAFLNSSRDENDKALLPLPFWQWKTISCYMAKLKCKLEQITFC